MQTFDIVTIRLFLAIVRAGSIGEAARREHIATSAVSRRINDLEAMLGVRLLRRLPRGVEPTPEGKAFAAHGERLLAEMRSLADELRGYAGGERGEVWFAAINSVIAGCLPDLLVRFRAEKPHLKVAVQESYSREAIEALREGRIDLAVVADSTPVDGLAVHHFCDDPIWLITPVGHPLTAGRSPEEAISFAEAIQHEVISLHEGGALDDLIMEKAREMGCTVNPTIKVIRFGSLRRMVEAGLGIGFLRRSSVERYAEQMRIVAMPLSDGWAQRRHILVHQRSTHLPAAVLQFRDFLLKSVAFQGSESG
ncbi:LysR family transcriptional regulator [Telmatospirillum sp. J64-1]|uniref:LysR family transcriptional regulator n=1 Tax=Telmatospirillum sp. J64-1 TaxID=2502183 RepID=UPI00115E758E|nr:LysR family transcriptional regulator [Telmatospirillum sp. J64-1]